MSDLRKAAQMALEALELGYDSARQEAARYHERMAGYKQAQHDKLDAEVAQIASAISALRAALAAAQEPVAPAGWKLVPVEPTWDMKVAASTAYREARDGHYTARMDQARDCYAAMLAAAPNAPAAQLLTDEQLRNIANGLNGVQPRLSQWERDKRMARAIERAHGIGGGQ